MHAHRHHAGRVVDVFVITVSSTRTASEDLSGGLLREMIVSAGHAVAGSTIVPDDPEAIGSALDNALTMAGAVVLTGGTGVSARDCTAGVVRGRLDRVLPGFGEIFRALSYAEIGSAAMLSDAVGGVAKGRPVFALPGSTKACRLAMDKLILPELAHIAGEVAKEAPLTRVPTRPPPRTIAKETRLEAPEPIAPPREGTDITVQPDAQAREEAELPNGWRAAVRSLDGRLDRPTAELPDSLLRMQPVLDVLNAAGERATLVLPDGRKWLAFGYPDLRRNASKVLLVREALPIAEIVALHRWPDTVGLVAEDGEGLLPSVADERTVRPYEGPGTLFAVDRATLCVLEGKMVKQWDGRGLKDMGPATSALGSLVLNWSQR